MKFTVTPHAIDLSKAEHIACVFARPERHTVLAADVYQRRGSIEVDVTDAHAACEAAWMRFQNLEERHVTPDGGRSLMTGDMVEVVDADGNTNWWICCIIGWAKTLAPGNEPIAVGEGQ